MLVHAFLVSGRPVPPSRRGRSTSGCPSSGFLLGFVLVCYSCCFTSLKDCCCPCLKKKSESQTPENRKRFAANGSRRCAEEFRFRHQRNDPEVGSAAAGKGRSHAMVGRTRNVYAVTDPGSTDTLRVSSVYGDSGVYSRSNSGK